MVFECMSSDLDLGKASVKKHFTLQLVYPSAVLKMAEIR